MLNKRLLKIGVGIFLCVMLAPTIARAYVLLSDYAKYSTTSLKWTYTKYTSRDFEANIRSAMSTWNATPTKMYASYTSDLSSANIKIISDSYGNVSWAGRTSYLTNSTAKKIELNDYMPLGDDFGINTTLHEVGHCYGLEHNDDKSTIMYKDLLPTAKTTLSNDDINGVNAVYP